MSEGVTKNAVMILGPVRSILQDAVPAEHSVEARGDSAAVNFDFGGYELEVVTNGAGDILAMYYDGAQGSYEIVGAEQCNAALESENLLDRFKYKIKEILDAGNKNIQA